MDFLDSDIDSYKQHIVELRKYTKGMNVLVVEDYLILQKSLEKIFLALFNEVDVASDGVEALELYKQKTAMGLEYDIVFSDIAMPYMNGIELTKNIKTISPEQVIIIFSAYQDSDYLLELINLDVRRFILKPISLKNLLDELIFTCRSIYNQQNSSNKVMLYDNVFYLKKEKDLYIDNKYIKLSNYEQLILDLFISRTNQAVSNYEIINYLYANGIDIEFDNIRKIVYKLRKKIPDDIIQNVHGIGYRFTIICNN